MGMNYGEGWVTNSNLITGMSDDYRLTTKGTNVLTITSREKRYVAFS